MKSRRPPKHERILSAYHRTTLNTVHPYGCDGYTLSSDELTDYHPHIMLTLKKGYEETEPQAYRITGGCTCPDWRLGTHRDGYLCIHMEALEIRFFEQREESKIA